MADDRVIIYAEKESERESFSSFHSFRIDDSGIKREGYRLLPWQDVQRVRAWVTAGDGDWGYDEFDGLEISYISGYRLRVTNARGGTQEMLLYKLYDCLHWFLPAIAPDWREQVWDDYQRHYRRQQWLGLLSWFWYPNKPVIYERQERTA